MKIPTRWLVVTLQFFAIGLLVAAEEVSAPASASLSLVDAERLLPQRRAAAEEAARVSEAAYKAAAVIRHQANIIDPDPEGDIQASGEDVQALAEYMTSKRAYIKARNERAAAENALLEVLPVETLRLEIAEREGEMLKAFGAMTEFLQSGEVTDASPDSAATFLTGPSTTPKVRIEYMRQKGKYITQKTRLTKLKKALEAAEVRAKR